MATITKVTKKAPATFPMQAVEDALRNELLQSIESEMALHGTAMPANKVQALSLPIEIDSLTCVNILCAIEPLVGMELAEQIVQAGGYRSINAAVTHMTPRIEKYWRKKLGI